MSAAAPQGNSRTRILVIKHGALGDFMQALGPMQAIRRHHRDAHLTLLTTEPMVALARGSGWFEEIWVDERPSAWRPGAWLRLRRRLKEAHFRRVYDLQTSERSSRYFRLMGPGRRPEWSGIAKGASHPHTNPARDALHTVERQQEQLAAAGISDVPPADLGWLDADVERFQLPAAGVLLVPGGAAHRPEKRWPVARYATLARRLVESGFTPALIGGREEEEICHTIAGAAAGTRNLAGKTDLFQLAGLARHAQAAIGNDTGPMHIAAQVGCPSLILFSGASDPARCAPRGPRVAVLRRPELAVLTVDEVWNSLGALTT